MCEQSLKGPEGFAGAVGWWANKVRTVVTSVVHDGGCLQDVRAVCSHAIRASVQWRVCVCEQRAGEGPGVV